MPSSNISRMVLDSNGAEKLVEQGEFILKSDMRQLKGNCLHTSEDEIEMAVDEIKRIYNSSFKGMEEKYLSLLEKAAVQDAASSCNNNNKLKDGLYDELLPQAVEVFEFPHFLEPPLDCELI